MPEILFKDQPPSFPRQGPNPVVPCTSLIVPPPLPFHTKSTHDGCMEYGNMEERAPVPEKNQGLPPLPRRVDSYPHLGPPFRIKVHPWVTFMKKGGHQCPIFFFLQGHSSFLGEYQQTIAICLLPSLKRRCSHGRNYVPRMS